MKWILLLAIFSISNLSFANESFAISTAENKVDYHSYNFGNVTVGSRVFTTYRITNTGTTDLTFHSATISGPGFSAQHNCSAGLKPRATCDFAIYFWPMMQGNSFGRFRINFDPESDIVVDLFGYGIR